MTFTWSLNLLLRPELLVITVLTLIFLLGIFLLLICRNCCPARLPPCLRSSRYSKHERFQEQIDLQEVVTDGSSRDNLNPRPPVVPKDGILPFHRYSMNQSPLPSASQPLLNSERSFTDYSSDSDNLSSNHVPDTSSTDEMSSSYYDMVARQKGIRYVTITNSEVMNRLREAYSENVVSNDPEYFVFNWD